MGGVGRRGQLTAVAPHTPTPPPGSGRVLPLAPRVRARWFVGMCAGRVIRRINSTKDSWHACSTFASREGLLTCMSWMKQ